MFKRKIILILCTFSSILIAKQTKHINNTNNINNLITTKINNISKSKNIKKHSIGIYMAADNDLFSFVHRNIKQMQEIGSNQNLNILIHLDMHRPGQRKTTKRILVEKNRLVQIGPDLSMDSGNTNTLIDFYGWISKNFPAENYGLFLWNHGTGIIEPRFKKAINPSELFFFNSETKLIELDRKIGFLDYINNTNNIQNKGLRGICFDDTTRNYLTNKDLKHALNIICNRYLGGKKMSIVACDACLMSMLEVAYPLKNCVEYFIGSEEVELGTGYDYKEVFSIFNSKCPTNHELSCHIVSSFYKNYHTKTHDYTHSAIDISKIEKLKYNVDDLAKLLIHGLDMQLSRSLKNVIRLSKHKNYCTHFDEPSYIDLGHFYANLLKNIDKFTLKSTEETNHFKHQLKDILTQGLNLLNNAVIANVTGRSLKDAKGIAIYFPEFTIDRSYYESDFANDTHWLKFLITFIKN